MSETPRLPRGVRGGAGTGSPGFSMELLRRPVDHRTPRCLRPTPFHFSVAHHLSARAILNLISGKMAKDRKSHQASPPAATAGSLAGGKGRSWRRHGGPLVAIWGLVLVAYSNSFQGTLVFDSAAVIGRDPRIRQATLENIGMILTGGYRYVSPTAGLYRPFTTFSYLLNYAVLGNGPAPAGYPWVNFVLHEVNVALVYALGVLIFGETAPALALAAIWGLHPLVTESVTNIVGRADLLAALGVLAGMLCHARGASPTGGRRVAWVGGLGGAAAG